MIVKDYCSRCKGRDELMPKPYAYSYSSKGTVGYRYCRPCTASRLRAYRKTDTGAERAYEATKRQYAHSPLKARARSRLNYHLRKGNINKPNACSDCNQTKRLDAHHEDYSLPLDVIWLCRQCHANLHYTERRPSTM